MNTAGLAIFVIIFVKNSTMDVWLSPKYMHLPVGIYLLKINSRNTRTGC